MLDSDLAKLYETDTKKLKLLRYPADHFEGFVTFVAVLMFFVGVDQGKIAYF